MTFESILLIVIGSIGSLGLLLLVLIQCRELAFVFHAIREDERSHIMEELQMRTDNFEIEHGQDCVWSIDAIRSVIHDKV